jgi:hypothetical protein
MLLKNVNKHIYKSAFVGLSFTNIQKQVDHAFGSGDSHKNMYNKTTYQALPFQEVRVVYN